MFNPINPLRALARRPLLALLAALVLATALHLPLPAVASTAAAEPQQPALVIHDLYHAYEVWESQGIKFVVRDKDGHFVTWGIGRLESWNGTRTVLCVRNPHGAFLTWAQGRIENWKNDTKRYVFRDKKGHFLQWAALDLTSAATFGENLERFVRTNPQDTKHFNLLHEILEESILADLAAGKPDKAIRFASRAFQLMGDPSESGKFAAIVKPILAWLKPASLNMPQDALIADLYNTYNDLAQMAL